MWLLFFSNHKAYAEEVSTVQIAPSDSSTVTTVQLSDSATAIIESAQADIAQAETATALIETRSQAITSLTETITATITQAQDSILQAQTVVDSATVAMAEVDSATVLVTEAEENVIIAEIAVESQTAVVEDKTLVVESATAAVNENTTPGLTMTVYSNPGTNGSPEMGGNLVYTGIDTDGIYEVWGNGGPTVNGPTTTTTITETFTGNQLNTNIEVTVNGVTVSTTNNGGTYIGAIGFPSPGSDPSLVEQSAVNDTLITLPENTTSASFDVFAKNGDSTGVVTYTDGTTETFTLQHNVSPEYPNYINRETFTAPTGKTIATILVPANWDYYAIDNISATSTTTSTTIVTEDFQVRWQGLWTPEYTGTQYITAQADDGVRLYLDGELVIDDCYDKGGGGSTADVMTTAGVAKVFDMWYYENGGGAVVYLQRYTGSGWELIPASEFSTTSATPEQIQTLQEAQINLEVAQATLDILESDLETAEEELIEAEENLEDAQEELESALVAVTVAVSEMNANVTEAQNLVVQTLAAEEAERARLAEEARLAEIARQAAIAAENARIAAQLAYEAEQARIKAEAEAKAAAEEAARIEAERIAAEEAAKKAEEERIAAEKAASEAKAKEEAEAIAKAEAEAKLKAEEEAKAKAEADILAEEEKKKEEELKEAIEAAKSGKEELSEEQKEIVVNTLIEDLKPGQAVTAAAIVASGISYADLPPSTPVETRTDASGNPVIITAEVAAQVELVSDPAALVEELFTNPGAAIAALGSIGADMSPEEREESTKAVVATVVAAGAAISAVATTTSAPSGGGAPSGGSSSGANSGSTRRNERW